MVLDHYILAFGVAGLVEAFVERAAKVRSDLGRSAANEADARHRRLLRTRGKVVLATLLICLLNRMEAPNVVGPFSSS